ncbi:DASS family sodium-coupled anion symporter [Wenzhouxiangella sp. 15181]|nr:DASS family sodium-coupled anion symporter [Wenzhouxiangella sp. 15181]RFP68625.1 DASS family sodium-coupled anion symporter [Wenzhouxiangella sp. 15190]
MKFLRPRIGLIAGLAAFVAILLLPAPDGMPDTAWQVAAVAALMVVWWISEALPIAATALLPIVLFPVLGVTDIAGATTPFANPLIYLFLGGFIIALGMERSGLHRRIAINIIRGVGTKPTAIIAGFMLAAAFLSMWVSNTATAMMMLPIALSVTDLADIDKDRDHRSAFALVLLLALAYACNIGGLGTLIGTPPNALLAAWLLDNHGVEIGFSQWMLVGLPLVIVALPLVFLLLTRVLFPLRVYQFPGGDELIRNELARSGRTDRAEKQVAVIFVLTAGLWIGRPLLETFLPGLSDTGIAIFGALLLFIVPIDWREWRFVLSWRDTARLPWEVLILFGGGLSLAAGISDSGLAEWIGQVFQQLDGLSVVVLIGLVVGAVILLTEVTSNTATAAAFLPILGSVAVGMGLDPIVLAAPAAVAASCAFMLPVATPPNAIVYGSGLVTIPQMARAGLVINLVMVIVVTGLMYALLGRVFAADLIPG